MCTNFVLQRCRQTALVIARLTSTKAECLSENRVVLYRTVFEIPLTKACISYRNCPAREPARIRSGAARDLLVASFPGGRPENVRTFVHVHMYMYATSCAPRPALAGRPHELSHVTFPVHARVVYVANKVTTN